MKPTKKWMLSQKILIICYVLALISNCFTTIFCHDFVIRCCTGFISLALLFCLKSDITRYINAKKCL